MASVIVLEGEVGTTNGSSQPRLLPRELESRGELRGGFHPVGESARPSSAIRSGGDPALRIAPSCYRAALPTFTLLITWLIMKAFAL